VNDFPAKRLFSGFRCNNACQFCDQGDEKERSYTRQELMSIVETIEMDGSPIMISGGEATLEPPLLEWLVTELKSRGAARVELFTNGRMLSYGKLVDSLKSVGVERFHVSLHGPTARSHDWLTRVPGSFEQTVRGIRRAVSEGVPVDVHSVVVRSNYRDLPSLIPILNKLRVKNYHLRWVVPEGRAMSADRLPNLLPKYSLARPYVDMVRKKSEQANIKLVVHDVPLCVAGRNAPFLVSHRSQWYGVASTHWKRTRNTYPDLCENCEVRAKCKGIPIPYLDYYGDSEFQPL